MGIRNIIRTNIKGEEREGKSLNRGKAMRKEKKKNIVAAGKPGKTPRRNPPTPHSVKSALIYSCKNLFISNLPRVQERDMGRSWRYFAYIIISRYKIRGVRNSATMLKIIKLKSTYTL